MKRDSMPLQDTPAAREMAKSQETKPNQTSNVGRNDHGDPQPITVFDIQLLLKDLINPPKSVSQNATIKLQGINERGSNFTLTASLESTGSTDAQILDLFRKLKIKMDAAVQLGDMGRKLIYQAPPALLDTLLARRYGARREGLRMYWNLEDGIYFFDPFTKKITRKRG